MTHSTPFTCHYRTGNSILIIAPPPDRGPVPTSRPGSTTLKYVEIRRTIAAEIGHPADVKSGAKLHYRNTLTGYRATEPQVSGEQSMTTASPYGGGGSARVQSAGRIDAQCIAEIARFRVSEAQHDGTAHSASGLLVQTVSENELSVPRRFPSPPIDIDRATRLTMEHVMPHNERTGQALQAPGSSLCCIAIQEPPS
jgi:hypothetical protein